MRLVKLPTFIDIVKHDVGVEHIICTEHVVLSVGVDRGYLTYTA